MSAYYQKKANFVGINYQELNSKEDKSLNIAILKNKTNTNIYCKNTLDKRNDLIVFDKKENAEGNIYNKSINLKYESGINRIELVVKKESKIVEDFEKEVNLDDKNRIIINDLKEEQLQNVMNKLAEKVGEKFNSILEENIKIEDFMKIFENTIEFDNMDLNNIKIEGVTETEKNRFNSKFEILKSKEIEKDDVIKVLDVIKDNLIGVKVESNTVLRLELSRQEMNEKVYDALVKKFGNLKDKKYNIDIEYDSEIGLAKYVLIEIK